MNKPEGTPSVDDADLSNKVMVFIVAFNAVVYLAFAGAGQAGRGLAAAFSGGAVLMAAALLRFYANQTRFWAALISLGAAHALVVFLVPWPASYHGAGIVFAPVVCVDAYLCYRLMRWVVKSETM